MRDKKNDKKDLIWTDFWKEENQIACIE